MAAGADGFDEIWRVEHARLVQHQDSVERLVTQTRHSAGAANGLFQPWPLSSLRRERLRDPLARAVQRGDAQQLDARRQRAGGGRPVGDRRFGWQRSDGHA